MKSIALIKPETTFATAPSSRTVVLKPGAFETNVATLRTHWGAKPAMWLVTLAEACDRESQGKAAARLGVSAAVVNQALKNAYKGRLDRLEERVRGEFMREVVACPILGELSKRGCLDHQERRYCPTNPLRVKLFNACKTCPNRRDS